jgi:hypothetical protein
LPTVGLHNLLYIPLARRYTEKPRNNRKVFAMAKRKTADAETAQPQSKSATEAPPPADAERAADAPQRFRLPDEQKVVLVAPGPESAKLRLLRSHRYKQMQIPPDEDLPPQAREKLEAAGWTDRTQAEGIWTKQLPEPGADGREPSPSRRRVVFKAERLFEEIANDIRAHNGLPPVRLDTAAQPER